MIQLNEEECELLLKKLEYTFKKKAGIEIEGGGELSRNAQLLKKIKEGIDKVDGK